MFTKILAPTDLSDASAHAVNVAKSLARTHGSELHVLLVVDDPILNAPTTAVEFRDQAELQACGQLETLFTDDEKNELHPRYFIREGTAYAEIVQHAIDHGCSLIVMATHGRSALMHMLLGSVAENVLRYAPAPVLSVPDPAQKRQLP